jgi:Peptidase inhibitor I78 family
MDLRIGLITVLLTSGLTLACASRTDAPTAPTDVDRNNSVGSSADTSTRRPLPPTAPPPPSGMCDATKAQSALGERASQELLDRMRVAAGAGAARFIRPNERITLEFSPARLNLNLNTKDVVQSVYCG